MSIKKISINDGGLVIIPADQIASEAEIEITHWQNSTVIVYEGSESLSELVRVAQEQHRLNSELAQKHRRY